MAESVIKKNGIFKIKNEQYVNVSIANEIWLSFTATTGEVLRLGFVAGNQNFKIRMMDKNWQELWHIN